MKQQTRADIATALRAAARTLRAKGEALPAVPAVPEVEAPEAEAPEVAEAPAEPEPPEAAPVSSQQETALANFIRESAAGLKQNEEQDPASFMGLVEAKKADLLRFATTKQMYQEGPKGSGATALDPTPATQTFERLLRVMTETGIDKVALLQPFIDALIPKNWGDVNVDDDLVLVRYETPGPVTGHLDRALLEPLVEAARAAPGSIDRAAVVLKDEHIAWEPTDVKTGTVNCAIVLDNVDAKWCAVTPTDFLLSTVVDYLSVLEVNSENTQQGWWDAARIAHALPAQLLPIIRGKDKKVIFLRSDADQVEEWAAALPGWSSEGDLSSTPLIVRDAVSNDILS